MRAVARLAVAGSAVALGVATLVGPAWAQGSPVGGAGSPYSLNDSFTGTANTVFAYGTPTDVVYAGDWDGNGTDTLAVRRGNTYYLRYSLASGPADKAFSYGRATDTTFVGDWNGDGVDTLGVRRAPAPRHLRPPGCSTAAPTRNGWASTSPRGSTVPPAERSATGPVCPVSAGVRARSTPTA